MSANVGRRLWYQALAETWTRVRLSRRAASRATTDDNPYTGAWRPESPLSALTAHSADGTWNFHVADQAAADVGSVRAFSLHLSGFVS